MPELKTIKIKRGFANGKLDLSENGNTRAWRSDFISWEIKNSAKEVVSIVRFEPKADSTSSLEDIFSVLPYQNGNVWSAEIKGAAVEGSELKYLIVWMFQENPNGPIIEKRSDPTITIRPRAFAISNLIDLAIPALTFLVGAFSGFIYFKMNRMEKKRENERLKMNK